MTANWLRRGAALALCSAAALLSACGSSTVESSFTPNRLVVFGDGMTDLGQTGARYTVNDGSANIWTQQLAASYGAGIVPAVQGGASFATGNARITAKPDAAGNASTPTITEQITGFLAGNRPQSGDLVVVSGGTSDLIADFVKFQAGTLTNDQFMANAKQYGNELSAQVHRVVAAGAQHVMVSGTYDLSRSPLALARNGVTVLFNASAAFNSALLIGISDLGSTTLYVDAAYYFNLMTGLPGNNGFNDGVSLVCNSVDPGPGIGIGANQENSRLCTPSTIRPVIANYNQYVFADQVYPTPQAHRLFGSYAFSLIKSRF